MNRKIAIVAIIAVIAIISGPFVLHDVVVPKTSAQTSLKSFVQIFEYDPSDFENFGTKTKLEQRIQNWIDPFIAFSGAEVIIESTPHNTVTVIVTVEAVRE